MNKILVGADPEVFVSNNGSIVSVVGHLGGTKKDPLPVLKGALQEDNVLAEFNIDPASSREEFVSNIKTVMGQLRERIAPFGIEVVSSHVFEKATLIRSGRQAMMFGCDPDFNAYTGEQNVAPSARTTLRTAGGHIHIGYDSPTEVTNRAIVRAMDVFLGLPSLLIDGDERRRQLYGKAGCYRNKSYGVEYRTLSNFWLLHTDLVGWAYDQAVNAYEHVANGYTFDDSIVQGVINSNDIAEAESLIKKYGVRLP